MFEKIFAIYVVIFPVLVYISLCFRCNSDDCKYIKRRGGQVTANIVAGIIIFLLEDMDKELQRSYNSWFKILIFHWIVILFGTYVNLLVATEYVF